MISRTRLHRRGHQRGRLHGGPVYTANLCGRDSMQKSTGGNTIDARFHKALARTVRTELVGPDARRRPRPSADGRPSRTGERDRPRPQRRTGRRPPGRHGAVLDHAHPESLARRIGWRLPVFDTLGLGDAQPLHRIRVPRSRTTVWPPDSVVAKTGGCGRTHTCANGMS